MTVDGFNEWEVGPGFCLAGEVIPLPSLGTASTELISVVEDRFSGAGATVDVFSDLLQPTGRNEKVAATTTATI